MSDGRWHLSSAVVNVALGQRDDVQTRLEGLDGVEVHGGDANRIVITIEGTSTGVLGDRLTQINLMPGVLVANMVFEHAEELED